MQTIVGILKLITRTYVIVCCSEPKIVTEYDQELQHSQTADNPVAPRGRPNAFFCILVLLEIESLVVM